MDHEERIPCPDDLCTGTLNAHGVCNYCGATRDGRPVASEEPSSAETEEAGGDEERIPCFDDLCTGTLNARGVCNYCGKSRTTC